MQTGKTFVGAAALAPAMTLLIAVTLAGCQPAPLPRPPLEGARIGAPLALVDQRGQRRADADFLGRYRLLYFGYTTCPDVCPVDLANLIAGFKRFEAASPALAAKVQPIFVTLDPERDTVPVIRDYAGAFHPRLIGLTGTPAEIAAVAKGHAVYYAKQPGSAPDRYLVSHAQLPYLMDPAGKPLALLPVDDPATDANEASAERVAAELARWVE